MYKSEEEFLKNYENDFIKKANPEWRLTIVDCHIWFLWKGGKENESARSIEKN